MAKDVILKDVAILRISNKVYLDSDLKVLYKRVKTLDCLMGGSYLLEKIGIRIDTAYPKRSKGFPSIYKSFYKKLLTLVQIRDFLHERSIFHAKTKIDELIRPNLRRCGHIHSSVYDLLSAEIFFQERFLVLQDNKDAKSGLDRSIDLFFSTLESRIEYTFLF